MLPLATRLERIFWYSLDTWPEVEALGPRLRELERPWAPVGRGLGRRGGGVGFALLEGAAEGGAGRVGGRGSGGGSGGNGTPSIGMQCNTRRMAYCRMAGGQRDTNLAILERYVSGVRVFSGKVGVTTGRPLAKATPSAEAPFASAVQGAKGTCRGSNRQLR